MPNCYSICVLFSSLFGFCIISMFSWVSLVVSTVVCVVLTVVGVVSRDVSVEGVVKSRST